MKKVVKFILKYVFYKIPLYLICALLIFFFFFYLVSPIYKFDKQGESVKDYEYWYNPYQKLENQPHWYKINFHAHSNAWGKATNGRNNSVQQINDAYTKLGFFAFSISDYQTITKGSDNPHYIPVYEHGYNIPKAHQLSLGAQKVYPLDFPFFQTIHQKQYIINQLKDRCQYLALAHPPHWGGYSADDLKHLSNYDLFEVLNHYCISENYWDTVLTAQKWVYLIANDDCHDVSQLSETGRRFTLIHDTVNILPKIAKGESIGVDYPCILNESINVKAERLKKLPELLVYKLEQDSVGSFIRIILKGAKGSVEFIGDNGKIIGRTAMGDTLRFNIPSPNSLTYIRAKIHFMDGTVYYLNPIIKVKEPGIIPTNPLTASVSNFQTWSLRVIGFLLLLLIVLNIRAWRKKAKEKKRSRYFANRYR
ncbi:MAG: hypothetical protein RRY15_00405 [Bacteroidales bacterium]